MEKLKIEYTLLKDLKPNEYNPKQMSEKEAEDLKKSILEFGVVDPIIVNRAKEREGIIIGGHQRYKIYKKLDYKSVPVVYLNIPDLQKERELCLRLSKNTGSWDFDLLANFDEDLLTDVGFENGELDDIFELDIDENFDVEKELEKVLKKGEGRVNEGDMWQLGNHRLIIGDCIDRENWEKLLGDERTDYLLTDPPYKLAYTQRARRVNTKNGAKLKKDKVYLSTGKTDGKGRFKGYTKTKNGFGYRAQRSYLGVEKRGGVPEYAQWLSIANDYQNPKGANIMVFENWRNIVSLWKAMEKYWKIKNMIIWHLKNRCQGFSRKYMFFNKYDIAPLAGKGVLNEEYEEELDNYLKEKGQKLLDTNEVIIYGQKGDSYWDRRKGTKWAKATDHITHSAETGKSSGQSIIFGTKPVQILVPYIKILSPRNGIVTDPFGGSGSTLIGCEIMKRRARVIEIEPIYGEVILNRWEKFTGKKAKKLK
ncbi:MAG: DNA methyltransferase [Candidatus Aerophobetes bacterium]|nr:DNA methyltransferase [Candidatus Aerophobetes bacterium]